MEDEISGRWIEWKMIEMKDAINERWMNVRWKEGRMKGWKDERKDKQIDARLICGG